MIDEIFKVGYPVVLASLFFYQLVIMKERESESGMIRPLKGTIHISVDESFKPVIEEQITRIRSYLSRNKDHCRLQT